MIISYICQCRSSKQINFINVINTCKYRFVFSLHIPHFRYYYNTNLAQSHISGGLRITITGWWSFTNSSMLQTFLVSADRCLAELHSTTLLLTQNTMRDITQGKIK